MACPDPSVPARHRRAGAVARLSTASATLVGVAAPPCEGRVDLRSELQLPRNNTLDPTANSSQKHGY